MDHPTSTIVRSASRPVLVRSWFVRGIGWAMMGLLVVGPLAWWLVGRSRESGSRAEKDPVREAAKTNRGAAGATNGHAPPQREVVRLGVDQQRAVGLRTARVTSGTAYDVLTAPGRVAPNETQYAYITPRAAGVVRSVNAHVGQDVRAGDLLATIDSPVVGEARLELYTRLQTLEVAKDQAAWQETIYRNTLELIKALQKGESPEEIHRRFADRAVGENREKLMTAYAQYRLAIATIERNRELFAQNLITPKQFQQVNADYEVAQATYQSLMDQMGYEARLANTRARQARQQAEAAVRAAQERLRILGVKPDGTEPEVAGGKVVGVQPDGTLPASEKAGPAAAEARDDPAPGQGQGEGRRQAGRRPARVRPEAAGGPRQHLLDLGAVRRHHPRPRDDRPRGRRRYGPPHLHDGQPLHGLDRGQHPRERLQHAGPEPQREGPVPVPGLPRSRVRGGGHLHRGPCRGDRAAR